MGTPNLNNRHFLRVPATFERRTRHLPDDRPTRYRTKILIIGNNGESGKLFCILDLHMSEKSSNFAVANADLGYQAEHFNTITI